MDMSLTITTVVDTVVSTASSDSSPMIFSSFSLPSVERPRTPWTETLVQMSTPLSTFFPMSPLSNLSTLVPMTPLSMHSPMSSFSPLLDTPVLQIDFVIDDSVSPMMKDLLENLENLSPVLLSPDTVNNILDFYIEYLNTDF